MLSSDDDRPLWAQPGRASAAPAPAVSDTLPESPVSDELREGEGPLRPPQIPSKTASLDEEDWGRIKAEEAREAESEARKLEEVLAAETAVLNLPAFLAHPLVAAFLLGSAALLCLMLLSQVSSALASLSSLPDVLRYPGYGALIFFGLALLYAVGRFAFFYFRLEANKPIAVRALENLGRRTRLRWLVHEKTREAREQLAEYLRAYPLGETDRKALAALGLDAERALLLERARAELLDPNLFASSPNYFDDFRGRFQGPLDEVAERRTTVYARRVAVLTASSPNALLDTVVAGYCGFLMLADLCRIYNLRTSKLGTAVLLGRVFFNAYLAGQLHDLENVTEAGIQGLVTESGMHLGSAAADVVMTRLASKVGARVASGMLNYFLLQRLGRYAVRLLRPIQVEK